MKKPYIKKYCTFAGFDVWIVDGNYIRTNVNEEFTNFGHHYRFDFIPYNELWIDEEHGGDDEKKYYIDSMVSLINALKKGFSYSDAVRIADIIERRERSKDDFILGKMNKYEHDEELIKKIRKTLLKKYSGKVSVWIVNGRLVRDKLFVDFTEGGHDKVYPFIPENEIWIDDDISVEERKFILLHEIHERNKMVEGWCYYVDEKRKRVINKGVHHSAHMSASFIEHHCRLHPKEIEEYLKKEIELSERI